jgi:hypothetical protein
MPSSRSASLAPPPTQTPQEAARLHKGLGLPSMPRGAKEEGHNLAHSAAGHRIQREAGAIQVGGGANSVLDKPLAAVEGTLRAPRRHPPSVSRPRVCSDLLALRSAVMLGALIQRSAWKGYSANFASTQF